MSDVPISREDRWAHLVNAAFRLEDAVKLDPAARSRQVNEILDSAIEVFPSDIDPVEAFEAYAVRRMLLALRQLLSAPALDDVP